MEKPGFDKSLPSPKVQIPTSDQDLVRKREKLLLLERKIQLQEGLPFLYGWKWYPWALEFYESANKVNLLCAANQVSKSSTQIRKCINWATDTTLWPSLWPKHRPNQFWYLYPTSKQTRIEFETKWKLFLPTGKFQTDKMLDFQDGLGERLNPYHWKAEYADKELFAIRFINTGVYIYFKTYAQKTEALQTGTVHALFCDEELPVEHYSELIFRISASDGYFHMVFTATLGQEFWRLAMEPEAHEKEELPGAWKRSVSMYECQKYVDGTDSHWSSDKIQMVIDRCTSHNEVLRRVYGRFVMEQGGKMFGAFDIKRHLKPDHKLPSDWQVYEGVDLGSGGKTGHKAAICFVAVDPKFQKGRVFLGWRGGDEVTTAGDVFEHHLQLKMSRNLAPVLQTYDAGARDFFTIASRAHEGFVPADKSRDKGEQILNTLFKNDMLYVYATPELQKLATELSTLKRDTPKTKARDDFCDALRYAVSQIPWDWSMIGRAVPEVDTETAELSPGDQENADRRARFEDGEIEEARIEDEFIEWNAAYGCE